MTAYMRPHSQYVRGAQHREAYREHVIRGEPLGEDIHDDCGNAEEVEEEERERVRRLRRVVSVQMRIAKAERRTWRKMAPIPGAWRRSAGVTDMTFGRNSTHRTLRRPRC